MFLPRDAFDFPIIFRLYVANEAFLWVAIAFSLLTELYGFSPYLLFETELRWFGSKLSGITKLDKAEFMIVSSLFFLYIIYICIENINLIILKFKIQI